VRSRTSYFHPQVLTSESTLFCGKGQYGLQRRRHPCSNMPEFCCFTAPRWAKIAVGILKEIIYIRAYYAQLTRKKIIL